MVGYHDQDWLEISSDQDVEEVDLHENGDVLARVILSDYTIVPFVSYRDAEIKLRR